MLTPLEFEKPILELEAKIDELRKLSPTDDLNIGEEVADLQSKAERQLQAIYAKLTPWQKVQVARHPNRPHAKDYIAALIDDFTPLAGDRLYGDDHSVIGGIGRLRGRSVVVLGQEKGHDTESRVRHNFGMAHPEGYRKAQRLMDLADRFSLPVITFVDTPGAFPGVEAEERGQAEAIARCVARCLNLTVPMVATIIGEGGSGGAVALATANRVLMLEHAVYSVISPEGCASILWRSAEKAQDAADALKITAQDLLKLKVVDRIIAEPLGGSHRAPEPTIAAVGEAIDTALQDLAELDPAALRRNRREKFLTIGRDGLA